MICPHCHKTINPAAIMALQRAKSQTKKIRHDIAQKAARARWKSKD